MGSALRLITLVAYAIRPLAVNLTLSDSASMLCRDEAEVRQKAGELGLLEQSGKRLRLVR